MENPQEAANLATTKGISVTRRRFSLTLAEVEIEMATSWGSSEIIIDRSEH